MGKKLLSFCLACILCCNAGFAQQFVTEGVIEYEVKTNIQKTIGNGMWADMMKDKLPTFKTGNYKLFFNGKESLFAWDSWPVNQKMPDWFLKSDEESKWYYNAGTENMSMQKDIYGSGFVVSDSSRKIQWKLGNETRIIAGYTCRKATGIVLDSIYVFAFYTDEITMPAGPCSITGLPGTILGLTIPRLYTSYIATSITPGLTSEQAKLIKPVTAKKMYGRAELLTTLKGRTKDWISEDDADSRKEVEQLIWKTML